jgi:4-hydroxybenzoate polyprenyltransferase
MDSPDWPLVIDLDGTLLKTNSLDETLFDLLRQNPCALFQLPGKFGDIAGLKRFVTDKTSLDVSTWPIRGDFLEYVETHAKGGRRIVLATAADEKIANAIAARFEFITEVVASDGERNLKGSTKAATLRERYPDGFIYAGNSAADLAVWQSAAASVFVNVSPFVDRRARASGKPLAVFSPDGFTFNLLRRSLRLHQWAKNLLIFIPVILGGKAGDPTAWLNTFLGFLILGLAASATYIVNDLWDLPSDRAHRSKRLRPLASGDLSIRKGLFLAALLFACAVVLAFLTGVDAVLLLLLYAVITISYSFYLKRIPILDVFVLACLFTLRLGFGIALADVRQSPWLLVFSMFVFLSLSLAKRHVELISIADQSSAKVRGYIGQDAPLTLGLGLTSLLGSVLIVILYLTEDAFHRSFYAKPNFLWAVPAIMFLFLSRIWLSAQRKVLMDDPVAFALKDRICLILGLFMVVDIVLAMGILGPT